jgi:hypothetical protein
MFQLGQLLRQSRLHLKSIASVNIHFRVRLARQIKIRRFHALPLKNFSQTLGSRPTV